VRGRFAPSPTGHLHFGSLAAAFGSWLSARSQRGAWIVRMEDVDVTRVVAGAAQDILGTLSAFGMESDEPVLVQSERSARYAQALEQLRGRDLAYPCHCSRADLAAVGGVHPAQCVTPGAIDGRPTAWRLRVGASVIAFADGVCGPQSQDLARSVGDFVLRRADGCYSYQLAVVVDDADQGITEVVRGADLLDSTPRQIHLQRALGLSTPAYLHLPLALESSGRKLSKHDQARPVDPADPLPALHAALGFLGQPASPETTVCGLLRDAAARFDPASIPCRRNVHVAMRKD
jgi:glutamyl-Q tRNA(Asp) synthetase